MSEAVEVVMEGSALGGLELADDLHACLIRGVLFSRYSTNALQLRGRVIVRGEASILKSLVPASIPNSLRKLMGERL